MRPENTVFLDGAWQSWSELVAALHGVFPGAPAGGAATFVVETSRGAMTAAAALALATFSGAVLPRSAALGSTAEELARQGYPLIHEGETNQVAGREPVTPNVIVVPTSGSTGAPKLIGHTWETLWTYRPDAGAGRTWLLPYLPGSYAWFQLVTLGLFVAGQRLVPVVDERPARALELASDAGADAVSATPTFWRLALLESAPEHVRALPLQQITLGGEVVDQAILTRLAGLYPRARITHIYATTETGPAIVVHDGRAGFPAAWLEGSGRHGEPAIRVRQGRLEVRSGRNAALGPQRDGGWIATGDRVEVSGDRAVVVGRAGEDVLNVGGAKVSMRAVKEVLLAHPAVAWCRVSGVRAPLVGTLVRADVVVERSLAGIVAEHLDQALDAHCRERLPGEAVPRVWRFLDEIPVTAALKSEEADPER